VTVTVPVSVHRCVSTVFYSISELKGLEGTSGDHQVLAREYGTGTQLSVHAWLIANHRACPANSCIIHIDSPLTSQTRGK